ncbi:MULTISPECIES: glutaredoxin family protein [Microbacterium]|jgi:mycoredoxin|uniref:glutaredoxin family protein n=1 Tax=Microbacterium TaxID=33882 RepID=UPI0008F45FE5|nr:MULTISPECIES: glutaredoxin domain-containing protein [Microbacterium]MCT1364737.1 glutaredoxin family protein [Microbacterium sp. p3-SID131]MCT1376130.1 glutaredoxin family protein [Microbacterium sp. p3-SID337]MCZ0711223.1 glutaredoxin family protein [Microbacterium paraoxydans]MDH5131921.1 glutaredoxin domain-containing protein [Microbacterium sp. RD10]MDH5135816.1 glutaredoxin domain-containing protein [Microbacterium sp. RD11]
MTNPASDTITMFGADWCRDCIRTKKQLDELGVAYTYVDLVADPDAADIAKDISGRTNIPVVVYPDASHHVEPSNADVESKLRELSLI